MPAGCVGVEAVAGYNSFIVTNGGQFFMTSGFLYVGTAVNGAPGGNFNTVVLSTARSKPAPITVGTSSFSNSLTLLANTILNGGGNAINLGYQISGNNGMTVNGGTVTNVSGLYIVRPSTPTSPMAAIPLPSATAAVSTAAR